MYHLMNVSICYFETYTIFIISVIIEDKLNFLINSISDNTILLLPCIFVFFSVICLFFQYFVDFNKSSSNKNNTAVLPLRHTENKFYVLSL